jgi:hypothetical protein
VALSPASVAAAFTADGVHERGVVVAQGLDHGERIDAGAVVVLDRGLGGHRADRGERIAPVLAHAFAHDVGQGKDFGGLFVEQQVQIAELRPGHVPVEVLGLEVKREVIGEKTVQAVDQGLLCVVARHGNFLSCEWRCEGHTPEQAESFMTMGLV